MATLTPAILVVFAIILVALVLFATEPVPVDSTALEIMVALLTNVISNNASVVLIVPVAFEAA